MTVVLSKRETVLIVKMVEFINSLGGEELIGLAVSLNLPGSSYVEVCRELDRLKERLDGQ